MAPDFPKKVVALILSQILAFIKYSQQVAAILLWFLTFGLLFGLSITTLQEHSGGIPFLGLLPSEISLGSAEMLKIYGIVSLIYYLIASALRLIWPRKPLRIGARLKRASLLCGAAYLL